MQDIARIFAKLVMEGNYQQLLSFQIEKAAWHVQYVKDSKSFQSNLGQSFNPIQAGLFWGSEKPGGGGLRQPPLRFLGKKSATAMKLGTSVPQIIRT